MRGPRCNGSHSEAPACSSMDDARYISPSVVINGGKDMDGPYGIPEIAKLIEEREVVKKEWKDAELAYNREKQGYELFSCDDHYSIVFLGCAERCSLV